MQTGNEAQRSIAPLSRYMSEQARAAHGLRPFTISGQTIEEQRASVDAYYQPLLERIHQLFPARTSAATMGGVPVIVVDPMAGPVRQTEGLVLINLHGGGFRFGRESAALTESIPIAVTAGIRVVSVDYRMAPEHRYPAASDDVIAVYAALLETIPPERIGLFGCSAGGALAAQVIAWLHRRGLPCPAALGILGSAASPRFFGAVDDVSSWGGDSRFFVPMLEGDYSVVPGGHSLADAPDDYMAGVDPADPLASPVLSRDLLAKFPPTLLLCGTRSIEMSAAIDTHRQLRRAGASSVLELWDGMGHCFFYDPDLPETKEALAVIARFFLDNLA